MLVINSIEKTRLSADSFSYSGSGVAWKARLVLFLGFALMAGGLAGSVTVMVLKYLVRDENEGEGANFMTLWLGIANVVANALVMLRYVLVQMSVDVLTNALARSCFGFRRIWKMIIPITWLFDSGDREEKLFLCFVWNEKQDSSHNLSVHALVSPSRTRRTSFPRTPFYYFPIGFEQSLESSFPPPIPIEALHPFYQCSIYRGSYVYSAAVEVLGIGVTTSPGRHHEHYGLHHS